MTKFGASSEKGGQLDGHALLALRLLGDLCGAADRDVARVHGLDEFGDAFVDDAAGLARGLIITETRVSSGFVSGQSKTLFCAITGTTLRRHECGKDRHPLGRREILADLVSSCSPRTGRDVTTVTLSVLRLAYG